MSASSYVVLGLVEQCGTATPYDLKRMVDVSIGYFWDFPQSQLYAEAARLVGLGLLVEEQEPSGRRRRLLSVPKRASMRCGLGLPNRRCRPARSAISVCSSS